MKHILLFIFTLSLLSATGQKDTSTVEWIKAYFNAKSDHNYAFPGNESRDEWDMIGVLVDRMDSAKYSIDLAAYDLQNMRIGEALARAKRRGLKIRVITDIIHREHNQRFNQPMWDTLRSNGIISFDDAGQIYWPHGQIQKLEKKLPNSGANMHHKFAVIDAASPDPNDIYLWTGTMNLTYTGPWNTNATLLIKDSGIGFTYLEEFNQMWGSPKRPVPDQRNAKFHKDKNDVSEHVFWVNNTRVEVYFGPMDRKSKKPSISERITELINDYAEHDANFIAFAISSNINISQALLKKSEEDKFKLQGVIDPAFYSRYRNLGDIWADSSSRMGNRMILPGKEVRKLHSKTLILDAAHPNPNEHTAVTITGSYNFSKAAEYANDENILMIFSNEIANQYYQDFMGVMARAQGLMEHRFPLVDTSKWYTHSRVEDGQLLKVELDTNFPYPVSLLGIKAPRSWAGHKDSTYYFAQEAQVFLRKLTKDKKFKILGADDKEVVHKFGRHYAYILACNENDTIHINREMIKNGYAEYSEYYYQPQDSVLLFKELEAAAKEQQLGMWKNSELVGQKVLTEDALIRENLFPLNINAADQKMIQQLPGIGPGKAQAIIKYRDKNGPYRALIDLTFVDGMGTTSVQKLKGLIIFEDAEFTED